MSRLAAALEREGHDCHSPDLYPNDGSVGLNELADQLQASMDGFARADEPIVLIGFSMGALIGRIYFQDFENQGRILAFYSISGPHSGTWSAWFRGGVGARDMRPGSLLLKSLNKFPNRIANVVCYWTPFDLMVFPPRSACWKDAHDQVLVFAPAHPLMLRSKKLTEDIVWRVGRVEEERAKKKSKPG